MVDRTTGPTGAIVSDEGEPLILVDESDREIGHLDKHACHNGDGVLHRAFSLFIFNRSGELLLQQRSTSKRLWPLFWSNSCCSHPRQGESIETAIERRLAQELGMSSHFHHLFTFRYQASYLDIGSEREVCWVFAGLCDQPPQPNIHEINAVRWIAPDGLDQEFVTQPDIFTPWFAMEWPRVRAMYRTALNFDPTGS